MVTEPMTVDEFMRIAPARLAILEEYGFRHDLGLDVSESTLAAVTYVGKHVALRFSLDVRDQQVDARVHRVKSGDVVGGFDGGYSANIFSHLVEREGYRGSAGGWPGVEWATESDTALDRALAGWINLLQTAGRRLLDDRADSL